MIALVALASIVGGFLYINRGRTIDEANVYVHEDYFGIEIHYSVMPRGRISTTAVEYE